MLKVYDFRDRVDSSFYLLERIKIFRPACVWVSTIEEADVCFCPIPFECIEDADDAWLKSVGLLVDRKEIVRQFESCRLYAQEHDKWMIILYYWDNHQLLNLPKSILLRTAIYESQLNTRADQLTIAIPALHLDERNAIPESDLYDIVQPIEWNPKPTIGFRGTYAQLGIRDKLKSLLNEYVFRSSVYKLSWPEPYLLRARVIKLLRNAKICRLDYRATEKVQSVEDYHQAFIQTLQNNQYSLCIRGFGNYSFRLYESFAAGRIPLFVNTDCVLPFADIINYKQLMCFVDDASVHDIESIVLDFHQHNKERFDELQKKLKSYWFSYLSSDAFPLVVMQKIALYLKVA